MTKKQFKSLVARRYEYIEPIDPPKEKPTYIVRPIFEDTTFLRDIQKEREYQWKLQEMTEKELLIELINLVRKL